MTRILSFCITQVRDCYTSQNVINTGGFQSMIQVKYPKLSLHHNKAKKLDCDNNNKCRDHEHFLLFGGQSDGLQDNLHFF